MNDTRDELVEKLRQLADANSTASDREVMAAAGVLSSLVGALCEGTTIDLLRTVGPFSEAAVRRLSTSRN